MGLKKRLAVAFCILLIVPVLLLGITSVLIFSYQNEITNHGKMDTPDGEMYYIIKDNGIDGRSLQVPFMQTIFFLGMIIILTALTLVMWLYSSLIKPLNVLRMATRNMKEGNLDFSISGDPDDELGQLCEEFEEMRKQLKDQIDARMKYEQDTVELISNISHDLKTPLTAIKGYAEGILDGVADTPDKQTKYLRTIYNKASDMTVLVDELSFYSKIDSNIVPYNFDRIDVNSYFKDCVDDISLDMEVKGIALEYESRVEDGVTVKADPEQLRRVINNIIGNAVKYMDKPQGKVSIRTSIDGDKINVEIEDTGMGIAEEDLKHIFERFYRADSSRGTKKGGSGLGLAIAKKIIEDHGGTISAVSTPGVGSCFSFTLPAFTESTVKYCEIEDAEYEKVSSEVLK